MTTKSSIFIRYKILLILVLLMPLGGAVLAEGEPTLLEKYSNVRTGTLDQIDENEVVIDEAIYTIVPETEYYTAAMNKTDKSIFKPGQSVEYSVENSRFLLALRLIK